MTNKTTPMKVEFTNAIFSQDNTTKNYELDIHLVKDGEQFADEMIICNPTLWNTFAADRISKGLELDKTKFTEFVNEVITDRIKTIAKTIGYDITADEVANVPREINYSI